MSKDTGTTSSGDDFCDSNRITSATLAAVTDVSQKTSTFYFWNNSVNHKQTETTAQFLHNFRNHSHVFEMGEIKQFKFSEKVDIHDYWRIRE